MEITQSEQQKEKHIKKKENSLRDIWDIKHTDICIKGVPEEDRKELKMYLMKLWLKSS